MGYKIGVPSLKLNNVGKTSKHCGSFGAVTREALEEREGHDIDIDHTKSKDNVITGYRTSAELMEYSRQHCENLRDKSGRKLRADAVVMCGTIFKPPAVFINALSEEARKKFFDDCKEYFAGVVGKENIKSTVLHKDERAEHLHIFWEPMTADGRLCAKEVHNLKFFSEINHNLPAFLRERGWDIEDAQCYDCAAENYEKELQKSQQQLEAEYQKRNNSGLPSMEYKKRAEEEKRNLQGEIKEIKKELSVSINKNNELKNENVDLMETIIQAQRHAEEETKRVEEIESRKLKAEKEETEARAKADALKLEVGNLQSELEKLTTIKTISQRDEEASEVSNILSSVYDFISEAMSELKRSLENGLLNTYVQNLLYEWEEKEDKIINAFNSVIDKIKNIELFEKIKNVDFTERRAPGLNESLSKASEQASELIKTVNTVAKSEEEYLK